MEQLSLQRDEVVSQNRQLVQVLDEGCQSIPQLAILADTPAEAHIHRLAAGVHKAQEEMKKVQLDLNLQIAKLRLKPQPSTLPKVREQRANTNTITLDEIGSGVRDCTRMFEESFEVLMNLQEDPNIQRLETEACELQQQYDRVKGTVQMVALTQRLVRMQQAKVLKAQVDATQHKEAVLKVCIQLWIDEAFTIIAAIEGKLTQMQGT